MICIITQPTSSLEWEEGFHDVSQEIRNDHLNLKSSNDQKTSDDGEFPDRYLDDIQYYCKSEKISFTKRLITNLDPHHFWKKIQNNFFLV